MENIQANSELSYLKGGGKMGNLIRNYPWENTPLGNPEQWPQSLRTTLGVILNSKFPMFLWWGKDLIQFYNDAYRPSLGNNGKHPVALGQRGEDCWPEIWPTIKPLIDQVFAGEATWSEDQLIPIYRNGKMEDVYWTFGYSPVNDESGNVGGVLVVCNETTDKVRNFKTLQDKERNFRNIFSQAPVAVAIFRGITFIIEFANEKVLEYWDRTLDQIINKPLFEALPEAAGQGYEALLKHVFTKGERFVAKELFMDLKRKDKLERTYINFVYEPYHDLNGNISGVILLANEITDQVLSRNKLEESEKNLRSMILQSPVAMCIFKEPQHIVEVVNDRMLELWGKPSGAVSGKPIFEGLPEAKGQGFELLLDNVYNTGETFKANGIPINLPRNNSIEIVYVNFVYEAFKEADGRISGVMAGAIEVTDQVITRKKIEEAEQKARLSIEAAALGTFEINLLTNAIIGSSRSDTILDIAHSKDRQNYFNAIHPLDLEIKEEAFRQVMKTGVLDFDARILKKNGLVSWIGVKGNVYFDEANKPEMLLGVIQDITVQKEMDRQKDDFVSVVSHELKTPLTSILAYSEILREKFSLSGDEESVMMLSKMVKQVNRLNYIIQDLLDVTKIEGSKIRFRKDDFDFSQLVIEVIEETQHTCKTHKILMEGIEHVRVSADNERTSQVLTNILSNAIKYSPKGVNIIVSTYLQNEEIICSIKDFGRGIASDNLKRIFERFYQVSDVNRSNAGLGLGLYISAEIIKRQNGRIWVESKPGKGSTFYFSLPIKKQMDQPVLPETAKADLKSL